MTPATVKMGAVKRYMALAILAGITAHWALRNLGRPR